MTPSKEGTLTAAQEWVEKGYEISLTRLGTLARYSDVWYSSLSSLPIPTEPKTVSVRQRRFKDSGNLQTAGIFAITLGKEELWELPWREKTHSYLAELGGLRFECGHTTYFLFRRNPGYPEDSCVVFERPERVPNGVLAGAKVVESDGVPVFGISEDYRPITQHGGPLTFINQHPDLMQALEKAGRLQRRRLY